MTGIEVVFSEDPRDFQRRDWSDLVRADPAGTIFHTPDFLKLYWEEFGEEPEHLLLAFAQDDAGAQVAAAAFELIGDTLRFLGGTEVTDYMGPVGMPDALAGSAHALWAGLLARDEWREADLRGLPEDSPWLSELREAAANHGLKVEETEDQNGVAPFLDLPATWDEYLAEIPSKLRHEIRRKAKKLEAETGPIGVETASDQTLLPLLDRFVELHRMSEGPKGVFMVPGMEIFFRRLGQTFCERGVFRLTFIRVRDELAAGTIGFSFEGTYSLYNSAFDRKWQQLAPGMVLVAEDIRQAIEEGCSVFDFLKGDYPYKYRFGARRRLVKRLVISRD
ncbi:MAG TPA: GNAT family N-acetyltransferase [Actinomycetota bacterium]|nr:GNAT family N-acetyltransferase [Actinomycetota bacterium]